jgi:protein involved in polysaccharide export with SLBB domain
MRLPTALLACGLAFGLLVAGVASAQSTGTPDPLSLNPRGLTDVPIKAPVAAPAPPVEIAAAGPTVFGANVFTGAFSAEQFSGFNPNYQIAIGDRINLRLWGAFTYESVAVVDAEGNIFIPNVGPVRVLGVRNSDLNGHIEAKIKAVYLSNVGVYATLDAAQPVKVYVTGFVRRPGLYGGSSWDSVLYYLDKAGGIDPARGSYRDVTVQRGGKVRAQIDLYPFLLKGSMKPLQLADGDTIVVGPRKHVITVSGEVLNPYQFEFTSPSERAAYVLSLAKPKPNATHINIARRTGIESRNEYYALDELANLRVDDGDEILVTADKYPGTILVRVEGANLSERSLILPYGARLRDAIERIRPAPQANMEAIQLFRKSLALRQKEMLDSSLRRMEAYVLTARSATSEEAALRAREADLVLQFIERARSIQPKGQIVLGSRPEAGDTLLEDGDTIKIPERTVLVSVHGEVSFPNTVVFDPNLSIEDYIRQAGGYTQKADTARLLVMHQDGTFAESDAEAIRAGDEILVLPKVESKNVEVTRGITQIIYQIAIAAKVAFGL